MFKKMKLKVYLMGAFAIILILAGIISISAIVGLISIKNNTDTLIDNYITAETSIEIARKEANVAARYVRELALVKNSVDFEIYKDKIYNSMNVVSEEINVLKNIYGESDNNVLFYEEIFSEWSNIANEVITLLEINKYDEAISILLSQCTPKLDEMAKFASEFNSQIKLQKEQMITHTENIINYLTISFVILFIFIIVVSLIIAYTTIKNILNALLEIKNGAIELSKGNLKASVIYEANNEFGELAGTMDFSIKELNKYVEAIDYGMNEFANGNFTIECPITFVGDFQNIQISIDKFKNQISSTLLEMEMATEQVSAGADEVAAGAQVLAQGATEQASSVQELSATIIEITDQITHNAEYSQKADSLGKKAGEVVQNSKDEMVQMMNAINDIALVSEDIKKIIKVIDDIAFQTNILALNAAVEAARAGTAGKGFAVVADEVRNLAQKSADAAKNTTELIENTLMYVEKGQHLANSTNKAFEEVEDNARLILDMVGKIAEASKEQAAAASQISLGVDQISSVIQMNSATSEESAASSEELSGQANIMKELIGKFQVNCNN